MNTGFLKFIQTLKRTLTVGECSLLYAIFFISKAAQHAAVQNNN
jgi:hypothetical protein